VVRGRAAGQVGVAISWGPPAGNLEKQQSTPLKVTPVEDQSVTVAFDISMAVKRGNKELREKIDAAIAKNQKEIDKILDDYGIVRVAPAPVAKKGAP